MGARRRIRHYVVVVMALPWLLPPAAFAVAPGALRYDYTLGTDYRRARFDWNIAGSLAGTSPNVLSELTWYDLDIAQLSGAAQVTVRDRLVLAGRAAYGVVVDGKNRDSDYNGDNRTQEFMRSNSKGGGSIGDASIGLGYHLRIYVEASERYIDVTPMVGYSRHLQYLKITDGRQIIPDTGPLSNLDSSYDAEWSGPWLGANMKLRVRDNSLVVFGAEYHHADYYAEANWNLRGDFAHPVSFKHTSRGNGWIFSLAFNHALTQRWDVVARMEAQYWRADPGTDTLYVIDTATGTLQPAVTRLNEVNWRSVSGGVAVSYHF
jgi:hypothetical protein